MTTVFLADAIADGTQSLFQLIAYFGVGAVLLAVLGFLIWKLVQNWQQGLLLEVGRLREDVRDKDQSIAELAAVTELKIEKLDLKIKACTDAVDAEVTGRRVAEREVARLQLAIMRALPTDVADGILGDRPGTRRATGDAASR